MSPPLEAPLSEGPWMVPSQERINKSNVERFRIHLNKKLNLKLQDYWQLHKFSVDPSTIEPFYNEVWDYFGIIGEKGEGPVYVPGATLDQPQQFFPNSKFNVAENFLHGHPSSRSATKKAIISLVEPDPSTGNTHLRTVTHAELYEEVNQAAEALRANGVRAGDVVAAYAANNVESVVFYLATLAIGATWTAIATEAGIQAVLDRFVPLKPKVLLSVDEVRYNGTTIGHYDKIKAVVDALVPHGLSKVVVVGHLQLTRKPQSFFAKHPSVSFIGYTGFLKQAGPAYKPGSTIKFHYAGFRHPAIVVFSSGTTGKPKGIVHGAGGLLISGKLHQILHADLTPDDVKLQYTTLSWMMWISAIASIFTGGTMIAYDGSPLHKMPLLWEFVERYGVTFLGIGPRYLQLLDQADYHPNEKHDLTTLRTVLSTGSPLAPEGYTFVANHIGKDIYLYNISGGTDIVGVFVGGVPSLPIYRGELTVPYLGCDVQSWDDNGNRVWDAAGHLVCLNAFTNMPIYFVDDPDRKKLKDAYFCSFKKVVWNQSDYCFFNSKTGGVMMLGRSDGVLNPSGVRFGSSELYQAIEGVQMKVGVTDFLAVGQRLPDGDERVMLFLKMQPGAKFSDTVVAEVNKAIKQKLSSRHVPAVVLECPDIPYTATGKRMEVPVKKIINNIRVEVSRASMANPDSLDFFLNNPKISLPSVMSKL